MYQREIKFDRETKDFALYLSDANGENFELVGYARTYVEGETTLDQLVAERLGIKEAA
jgi:hypothetical protein